MTVQVGIVGLGTWGTWHAGRLRQLPGFKLRSVCDITPERRRTAERDFGCRAHAKLDEFLADDHLQMVIVATPSHAHETPVLRALRKANINIVALHNHMIGEQRRLFFMHFWANDDAQRLARGLRAALDKVNISRG